MQRLKDYFDAEKREFLSTVGKLEYASWWILRLCMVGAIIYWKTDKPDDFAITIMELNLLATFAVPLLRILFFKKIFLGRLRFHVQSYINISSGRFSATGSGSIPRSRITTSCCT